MSLQTAAIDLANKCKISLPNLKSASSSQNLIVNNSNSFRSLQTRSESNASSANKSKAETASAIWNDAQKSTSEILQIVSQKKLCVVRKLGSQVDSIVSCFRFKNSNLNKSNFI